MTSLRAARGGEPARVLAQAAAATLPSTVAEEAWERTRDLILDTLAVIAAGSADPVLQRLAERLAPGPGPATLIGRPDPVAVCSAVLLNAAATTVEQLGDGHRLARGHPACHVVPAALATAEAMDASGPMTLAAILAGYEVAARVGIALGGTRPGVHDVGTWGALGAAVAVAHLRSSGQPEVISSALEAAAGLTLQPPASTVMAGASIHYLFAGLGVQGGLVAAEAALAGAEAVPGTLEQYFGPRVGRRFDPDRLVDGVGRSGWSRFEILAGYVKLHPTTAHIQGANDAVADLIATGRLEPDRIDHIEVRTYAAAARLRDRRPQNAFAARFSLPWTVAAAIVAGALHPDVFNAERLTDPAIAALARRVRIRHDPAADAGYPAGRPTSVTVHLRDGQTLSATSRVPRGDAANPVPRSVLHEKARACFARRFGPAMAPTLVEQVLALPEQGPRVVGHALRAAAG